MLYKMIKEKLLYRNIIFYLLPSMILLLVFVVPAIQLFPLSFHNSHTVMGMREYIGLQNYQKLFTPEIGRSLYNTFIYVFCSVPVSMVIGMFFAIVLNNRIPGRGFFWVLVFLPWAVPHSICATVFRWFIHSEYGLLNFILINIGLIDKPLQLLSVDLAMFSNILLQIWKAVPYSTITLLSGLQGIPEDLYEAAIVDGANSLQKFFYITLPSLRNIIVTSSLILGIWAFRTFELIWVLTGGGPLGVTETLPLTIYKMGFNSYNAGLASALGIVSLIILGSISIIMFKLGAKEQ